MVPLLHVSLCVRERAVQKMELLEMVELRHHIHRRMTCYQTLVLEMEEC